MNHLKTPLPARRRDLRGFTLIELLTVIAIIGILAAIILPVVGRVREKANQTKCLSNVRSLTQACHTYEADRGEFPPVEAMVVISSSRGSTQRQQANWVLILGREGYLDFVEQQDVNKEDVTYCPVAVRVRNVSPGNLNTYGMNYQASGGWFDTPGNARNMESAEEPTQTAMIMDGHWNGSNYTLHTNSPGGIAEPDFVHPSRDADNDSPSSMINVGFVDGSTRSVSRQEVPENREEVFWSGRYQP